MDALKLDIDEIYLGSPSQIGFRGLIRNSDCNWVVGFTGFKGYGSNLLPGFLALKHGLLFAWDQGL